MIAPLSPIAPPHSLLAALRSLAPLLQTAIVHAQIAHGTAPFTDPYQGLYITQDQVMRDLGREPGEAPLPDCPHFLQQIDAAVQDSIALSKLQQTFQLSSFEMAIVLMVIASEIDLRYERIYAYLQDDITRKRPTVELALNLLCATATDKLYCRDRFSVHSPLIRHGILHLIPDPNQIQPPLLAHYLKLDEQITRFLTHTPGLDGRLQPFSQLIQPAIAVEQLPLSADLQQMLHNLCNHSASLPSLYLHDMGGLADRVAGAIAHRCNRSLLTVDLCIAHRLNTNLESILRLLCREAQMQNAIVHLPGIDKLLETDAPFRLLEILGEYSGIHVLSGQTLPPALNGQAMTIALPLPDFAQQQTYWQMQLHDRGIALEPEAVNQLSNRFRLTPEQIDRAIATVCINAIYRTPSPSAIPEMADLFTAARQQCGQELKGLANKLTPHYTWNDMVLPEETFEQLQEVCNHAKYRSTVLGQWGFGRKLSLGKGISMLFCGSPGTGKTMAAEVIATDLQLDLYRIDLSQIVSKYIGETEKNLDRIFTAAERANAILFFDEADALFGKRSDVKDAHDRYANLEVGYLLQKMEEYTGVSVLATNLRQNIDDAFIRRIQAIVEFPFPDEAARYHLWQVVFPVETPLDEAIDFAFLAQKIKLAGGNIKNIALAAAFSAASAGERVSMHHLLKAAQREYQKSGRTWEAPISQHYLYDDDRFIQ
ncbi:MAG: ATP-binding protein [Elainella sp. C42_A2020_010]|nr:ATP-binding protein [Elainella sp. C42_A2020_010]